MEKDPWEDALPFSVLVVISMKFRLLSYNIHKGFNGLGAKFVLHEIRQALRETQCDVLLLQEVVGENLYHRLRWADWPEESQFEFLADENWKHFAYGKNADFDERHHGNAVLSRFPIREAHNVNISNTRWERRGLQCLSLDVDALPRGYALQVCNTHLDLSNWGRTRQLDRIIAELKTLPEEAPLVLAGDFNDWNQNLSSRLIQELKLQECFQSLHGHYARSFPSFWPLLTLDRIYVRGLQVKSAEVLHQSPWNRLSDHLPLLVELETI